MISGCTALVYVDIYDICRYVYLHCSAIEYQQHMRSFKYAAQCHVLNYVSWD